QIARWYAEPAAQWQRTLWTMVGIEFVMLRRRSPCSDGFVGSCVADANFRLYGQTRAEDRGGNERAMNGDHECRFGVDVGGTFTDLVLLTRDGCLVTRKVLSTSGNYAEAIFTGI